MIPMQNVEVQQVIKPQAIVDNDDPVGARGDANPVSIDTQGCNYLSVLVNLGATDITMASAPALYAGDTAANEADDSDFTAVTGASITAPDENAGGNSYWIHVANPGRHGRYFILEAGCGNGSTGTYITATAFLSRCNETNANSASDRGIAEEAIVT